MKKTEQKFWFIKDIIIFLIPCIIYSYILYVYFPGVLTYDSYNQLEQAITGVFMLGHPFFHTFIEFLLLKIWNSPAIIAFFQIIIFSLFWTIICNYNRKNTNSKLLYFFQVIITLLICLSPLNAISSITLWKDILFSYAILIFAFSLQILIEKKDNINNVNILFCSINLALIPNFRFNGVAVYLVFIFFCAVLIYYYKKNIKKTFFFVGITLIIFISMYVPNKLIQYKQHEQSIETGIMQSKILQLTGFYNENHVFSEEQQNIIFSYINKEELESKYNIYFLDPIGQVAIDKNIFSNNNKNLYKILILTTLRHPLQFINYITSSSTIVWKVYFPKDMMGTLITTGYDAENNVRRILQVHTDSKVYQDYNKYIDFTLSHPILKVLVYNPALHFYLSVLLCGIIVFFKKRKIYFVLIIPNFVNMLALTISIPLQDLRYNYASIVTLYLIIIVLIKSVFDYLELKKSKHS